MRDILRAVGLISEPPPAHVKKFAAAAARMDEKITQVSKDALSSFFEETVNTARAHRRSGQQKRSNAGVK